MHVSWYRRLFIVSLTTLLCFTLFAPAFATTPEFIYESVDVTGEFGVCDGDGFSVIEHVEGFIKTSIQYDQDGNFKMRISRYALRHTFSNSETGASFSSPDVGVDIEVPANLAVIGIVTRIVVPGVGPVFSNIGRVVYDSETFDVVFEAGKHDNEDDLLPVLCSALD